MSIESVRRRLSTNSDGWNVNWKAVSIVLIAIGVGYVVGTGSPANAITRTYQCVTASP